MNLNYCFNLLMKNFNQQFTMTPFITFTINLPQFISMKKKHFYQNPIAKWQENLYTLQN
jgi:hypothetical protein